MNLRLPLAVLAAAGAIGIAVTPHAHPDASAATAQVGHALVTAPTPEGASPIWHGGLSVTIQAPPPVY
jgi:hypothetical protein